MEFLGFSIFINISRKRHISLLYYHSSFAFPFPTQSWILLILDPTKAALCGITGVID